MVFGHDFKDAPEIDIKALVESENLKFEYEIVDDFVPDFTGIQYHDERSVLLYNLCTEKFERFTFEATHIDIFPLTNQTIVFGKIKVEGGVYQAEFNLHHDAPDLNFIVVYVKYFFYLPPSSGTT